jgi:hypothetical protein
MTPIATFPTLDDAESALDWIGIEFTEGDGSFEGALSGDDWELLSTAAADADAPGPVRDLARAMLSRWEADGGDALPFAVAFSA